MRLAALITKQVSESIRSQVARVARAWPARGPHVVLGAKVPPSRTLELLAFHEKCRFFSFFLAFGE